MNDPSYAPSSAPRLRLQRGLAFGVIIVAALIAFEIFNYSSTVYALSDLLGELKFLGISWATILAIAFCAIDFAGIARLFTPEASESENREVWYLFGAWLLAATMNAMLTWWGVSIAILNHQPLGNAVVEHATLLRVVPIFVAILVWLIRVLIIGTFSSAGKRLFSMENDRPAYSSAPVLRQPGSRSSYPSLNPTASTPTYRSAGRPAASEVEATAAPARPEPTYHSTTGRSAAQPVRTLNAAGVKSNDTYQS